MEATHFLHSDSIFLTILYSLRVRVSDFHKLKYSLKEGLSFVTIDTHVAIHIVLTHDISRPLVSSLLNGLIVYVFSTTQVPL